MKKVKSSIALADNQDDSNEEGPTQHQRQRTGMTGSARLHEGSRSSAINLDEESTINVESDEEVEDGETAGVNANAPIDDEDIEAQYVKLFSRTTFFTNLPRFRRSADAQLCEQLADGMWERAAKLFRIIGGML